ncbi:MAG: hypothetical protein U9O94_06320 [Nanoarchaeota archaeon]|nr:hypothetical protein [Nanoarchaeota archaeon]
MKHNINIELQEKLAKTATELGISVVKEAADEVLKVKPNLKLKHFIKGLDTLITKYF